MEQHKEPDIQLEQWNPPVKEWGPVYKSIFRAFSMIWRAGKVETVSRAFMRDTQILIFFTDGTQHVATHCYGIP